MKSTTINGKSYLLIPFNSGQMRHQIDPLIKRMGEMYEKAKALTEADATPATAFAMNEQRREIERENASILTETIQRKYPEFAASELDSLTDWQITALFNEFLTFTRMGGDDPGEAIAPAKKRAVKLGRFIRADFSFNGLDGGRD